MQKHHLVTERTTKAYALVRTPFAFLAAVLRVFMRLVAGGLITGLLAVPALLFLGVHHDIYKMWGYLNLSMIFGAVVTAIWLLRIRLA